LLDKTLLVADQLLSNGSSEPSQADESHPPTSTQTTAQPTTPDPAPNKDEGNAKARATQAWEAALNFTLAKVKIAAAVKTATTSETGAGALLTFYLGLSASGNVAAGGLQTVGVLTGETKATETGAEVATTMTSFLGFGTFALTGNLNKAATAAAVEGIVTSRPKDLAEGGTLERAAKAIDLLQSVQRAEGAIKNFLSPGSTDYSMVTP